MLTTVNRPRIYTYISAEGVGLNPMGLEAIVIVS
jgi:hypothetical protein